MDGNEESSDLEEEPILHDDPPPTNPRRYFNQQLRPIYERVPIPTLPGSAASVVGVPRATYTRTLARRGYNRWCHSVRTPPHPPANPLFGGRFRALLDMVAEGDDDGDDGGDDDGGDGGSGPSGSSSQSFKRPKTSEGSSRGGNTSKADAKRGKARKRPLKSKTSKPKKPDASTAGKPFSRKVPLNGVMRTFNIRMIPSSQQRNEFKRVFAVARNAYNWSNSEVKARKVYVTKINVRDHYVHNGRTVQPEWAGNVHSTIERAACEQLATAHLNGIKAVAKGDIQRFDVAYKSHRKTRTEIIKIVKSTTSNGNGNMTSPFVAFRSAYSNAQTERLEAIIGWDERRILALTNKMKSSFCASSNADLADLAAEKATRQAELAANKAQLLEAQLALVPERRAECFLHLSHGFSKLGGIRLQDRGRVIRRLLSEGSKLQEDALIQYDKRIRKFYFCYRYDAPVPPDPDPTWETKRPEALDGGIRGFQHGVNSATGVYTSYVCNFKRRIHDRVEKLDNLQSRIARSQNGYGVRNADKPKRTRAQRRHDCEFAGLRRWEQGRDPLCGSSTPRCRARGRRTLARKLRRDRVRQTRWVRAVHYDAINHLLERADVVINPVLRTSQMAPRNGRVFGKDSTRAMLTMSHHRFNERLCSKAQTFVDSDGRGGRHVISDTGEPGTTRTCQNPNCGRWFAALGGAHVFDCPFCAIRVNRDDGGARGNLLAAYGKAVGIPADGTSNH